MMECRNSGILKHGTPEYLKRNAAILKHGTVVKFLTIGTHGFFPHKCSGQKRKWRSELHVLQSFSGPRCFRSEDFGKVVKKELHHFSDASTKALKNSEGHAVPISTFVFAPNVHLLGEKPCVPIVKIFTTVMCLSIAAFRFKYSGVPCLSIPLFWHSMFKY